MDTRLHGVGPALSNGTRLQTALERKCPRAALPATSVATWVADRRDVLEEGTAPESVRRRGLAVGVVEGGV